MRITSLANQRLLLLAILAVVSATLLGACGGVGTRTIDDVARDAEAALDTIDSYVMAGEVKVEVGESPETVSGSEGNAKYNIFFQAPDRARIVVTENEPASEDSRRLLSWDGDLLIADGVVLQRSPGSQRWRTSDSPFPLDAVAWLGSAGQIVEWLDRLEPGAEIAIDELSNERVLHVRGEWSEGGALGQPYGMEDHLKLEAWIGVEDNLVREAEFARTNTRYFPNDEGRLEQYEWTMTTHATFTDYNSGVTVELPEEFRDRPKSTPTPEGSFGIRYGTPQHSSRAFPNIEAPQKED